MTNLDHIKLITLAVEELKEAVEVYEKAKSEGQRTYYAGYDLPKYYSKESIERRITMLRQDLLMLEKGL